MWATRTGFTRWRSVQLERYSPGGSRDTTVRLWDVSTGDLKQTFVGHTERIRRVAYANDGKTLACTAWRDNTLLIWDVETEELLKAITGHTERIESIVYAPDSRTLATGWAGLPRYVFGMLTPENS